MPVAALDHVGVIVRSLDATLPLYRDGFGLALTAVEELPEVGVRIAFLSAGGETRLQLLEPTRPGPLQEFLDREGEGLHHLCFAVGDIPATMARLAPDLDYRMHLTGTGRRASFLPNPIAGAAIELMEIEPFAAREAAGKGA